MSNIKMRDAKEILDDIRQAEEHLESLREELASLMSNTRKDSTHQQNPTISSAELSDTYTTNRSNPVDTGLRPLTATTRENRWPLSTSDYERYGRQLILPEIGLSGQRRLARSSVLVIGLGGLGCPAAKYLAGAGVGRIGLVDGDTVELSNLHRQILHTTARVGASKVRSAARSLAETNETVQVRVYEHHLTPGRAVELFEQYDLVLDCTDHPTSRYLISDAAVLAGKPLVSASALRTDGQLIVLNHPPRRGVATTISAVDRHQEGATGLNGRTAGPSASSTTSAATAQSGPCYRCIFPIPPPAHTLVSCGEGGVLGPVVGTMGVLQALEALKILTSSPSVSLSPSPFATAGQQPTPQVSPSMLIFSAYSTPPFRTLRMRPRRPNCAACGDAPTVTRESLASGSLDYVAFCGVVTPVQLLGKEQRWTPENLQQFLEGESRSGGCSEKAGDKISQSSKSSNSNKPSNDSPKPAIIDVRERTHFELGNLPGSINLPFSVISSASNEELRTQLDQALKGRENGRKSRHDGTSNVGADSAGLPSSSSILFVCRLGNDSQLAAKRVLELEGYGGGDGSGGGEAQRCWIGDLEGGLRAWKDTVEVDFPDF